MRVTAVGPALLLVAASSLALTTSGAASSSGVTTSGDGGERAEVSFIRKVSGPTPFKDCAGEEKPYVDAEVEPHLSVDPHRPNHLLAVWQQDRFASGGARSNVTAVSHDGGRNWRTSTVPGVSRCTDGTRDRASDPWTAIGADGTGYVSSMAVTAPTGAQVGEFDGDLVINRSRGGGHIWKWATPIAEDDGTYWHEKAVIEADPHAADTLYAAWMKHLMPDPTPLFTTPDVAVGFAHSDDRGATWSEPVSLPPNLPGVVEFPWGLHALPDTAESGDASLVVVGATHNARVPGVPGCLIYATRSDDGGASWKEPVVIARPNFDGATPPLFNADYEKAKTIRAGTVPCASSSTVSSDGTVHVTWFERTPDGDAPGGARIMYAHSRPNGGAPWTTGVVAESRGLAFMPTIALAGDGTVGVIYFDTAEDEISDEELTTRLRFASLPEGGKTWEHIDVHGSFDLRNAPDAGGYMLGEYDGLVGFPDGFGALVALAQPPINDTNATDIFYVRIMLDKQ